MDAKYDPGPPLIEGLEGQRSVLEVSLSSEVTGVLTQRRYRVVIQHTLTDDEVGDVVETLTRF
jgi:hypothetical protein